MTLILPPQLTYLPGYAPAPQGENLGNDPTSFTPAPPPNQDINQETTSTTQGQPKNPQKPVGCLDPQMLMIGGGMMLIMWFLMIRPQQKQEKRRKALLAAVKKNDKVVTNSGIHGTVAALDETTVTLKLDDKGQTRIKFDRGAIGRIISQEQE